MSWKIDGKFDDGCEVSILTENDWAFADVFPSGGPDLDQWDPDSIARAHLISAAPDLLSACDAVLIYLDALESGTAPDDPLAEIRRKVHAPLRAALEPAIAKAEGRS